MICCVPTLSLRFSPWRSTTVAVLENAHCIALLIFICSFSATEAENMCLGRLQDANFALACILHCLGLLYCSDNQLA